MIFIGRILTQRTRLINYTIIILFTTKINYTYIYIVYSINSIRYCKYYLHGYKQTITVLLLLH